MDNQLLGVIEKSTSQTIVSAATLVRGIERETIVVAELLRLEDQLKECCQVLKTHLEVMKSFGGETTYDI